MAKSKAKKQREKLEREGRLNPEIKRSLYTARPIEQLSLHTRRTKTKKDHMYKQKYKNTSNWNGEGDSCIFYFDVLLYKILSRPMMIYPV